MVQYGSGLRKNFRKDPIKQSILRTPPQLDGAIFIYGRIRSGKTVSMLSFAGLYHDNPNRQYKIFDLWGGSRNEHLYWGLPSNQIKYWNYAQKKLRLDGVGPKQYNVNYLYPLTSKLRKKLPFNPPYVKSKVFTIPIHEIKPEDFALVIGTIGDKSLSAWKETLSESKRNMVASEIIEIYKKKVRKDDTLYNSVLKPLVKEGLIQANNSSFNLTQKEMSKEIDNKEVISVLSLDFIDKEYQLFVIGYILRVLCLELDRRRRKVVGMIREASEFFRVNDQSIVHDRFKIFKTYLSDWIKMGRRGLHLFLDTQSPQETRGLVDGQQDLTLLGRLPSEGDRKTATEQLYKDGFVTKKQIVAIGAMNPGQFIVCPSGKPAYFKYMMLPRCRYWQEKNGNFYTNIWEKEVGRWISFDEELEKLKNPVLVPKEKITLEDKKEYIQKNSTGVLPEEIQSNFLKEEKIKEDTPIIEEKEDFSDLFISESLKKEESLKEEVISESKEVEEQKPKNILDKMKGMFNK